MMGIKSVVYVDMVRSQNYGRASAYGERNSSLPKCAVQTIRKQFKLPGVPNKK